MTNKLTGWEPLDKFRFFKEWREWGFKVAWFNLKFVLAYRWLGATKMSVRTAPKKDS